MRRKFNSGDTVAYIGPNQQLRIQGKNIEVERAVPCGEEITDGKTNTTEETVYRCRHRSGIVFDYKESELMGIRTREDRLEDIRRAYDQAWHHYRDALLAHIKKLIREMSGAAARIDASGIMIEDQSFAISPEGTLTVETGNPGRSFGEQDFPPEELAHIATFLGFIREGIDNNEFTISGDGTVKAA